MSDWRGNILTYRNAKTIKGEKYGWLSYIWYGAPNTTSGYDTCPNSSPGCRKSCLYYSGFGAMKRTQNARIRKTKLYFEDKHAFDALLNSDIISARMYSKKRKMTPCFRLDGTTDLGLGKKYAKMYTDVQFYDYTKCFNRVMSNTLDNWHLTYSLSENTTSEQMKILLTSNSNIAIPFRNVPDPGTELWGREIVSGDDSDLRFLDGRKVIVSLEAKGTAKTDGGAFVPDSVAALKGY
tara:strand:+ start:126 stop:836 length:711 start_codon:yes stop_codon:yes gene_type:complete